MTAITIMCLHVCVIAYNGAFVEVGRQCAGVGGGLGIELRSLGFMTSTFTYPLNQLACPALPIS